MWPRPDATHTGTHYLYGVDFPRGPRAKFVAFDQRPQVEEMPSKRFPIILNTGRILSYWHGGTITRRASNLMARVSELAINMSAEDGERYGVADGEWILVRSRRGEVEGRVQFTEKMRPGEVFIPFVKLKEPAANFLTNGALDSTSRIPEYKVSAVLIEKVPEPAPTGDV